MSGGLIDKVYIGLDNAPAAFDIKGRILGPVSFLVLIHIFDCISQVELKRVCNYRMALIWSTYGLKQEW